MKFLNSNYTKILFFGLMALTFMTASAQKKEAYEMMVDGVKVIVQPSNNDIVEIRTIIKGGVQNYTAEKQGIESLAMMALTECGTTKEDKNSFKNKLDKVSGSIQGKAGMDFSSISMNCIKGDIDIVWPLYIDAVIRPLFDPKEFARIKQDAINTLKSEESNPDYAIDKLAQKTAFAGKDYAKVAEGTPQAINTITAVEAKAFYRSVLTKSKIFIVVVGEIEQDALQKKLHALLANIPQGLPFILKKEAYKPMQNTFKSEKRDFATNYLQGSTGGPVPGSADYDAFQLAMRIFSRKHFTEIRSNNGLSYAPDAWFAGDASSRAGFFVSTTEPNKYINVFKALVNKTKSNGFTESELKDIKTRFLTRYYYDQETNSAQAAAFATNEVLHNNWKRAVTLSEDLKSITIKDLDRVFNKYVTNITWVYQGDPTKVNATLYATPTAVPAKPLQTKIPKPKD